MDSTKKRNLIIAALFLVAFLGCAVWLVSYFMSTGRAQEDLEAIKEEAVSEEVKTEETKSDVKPSEEKTADEKKEIPMDGRVQLTLDGFADANKKIDFAKLKEENEDIYSWITIPGTVIDYPIVQDPDDLDYYLNHNYDRSTGYPGCIYTENMNATDWEDNNSVIYGHNMKDGTMFAALHSYRDPEFLKSNPYVYIYSEKETRVYQIFAAYEVSDAHLLLTYNTEEKNSFGWYLDGIMEHEETLSDHYDKSLNLNSDDKIISLETCISTKPTMRYLVQAVLVARAENE